MGKGRRVGGSGWAGVHGSFIGLSKGKSKGKGGSIRLGKPKNQKPAQRAKIDLNRLPDTLEVKAAAKRVRAVQSDITETNKRLLLLQNQLAKLIDALNLEVKAARTAARNSSQPKAETKKIKQPPSVKMSDKKARANFRAAPKEVEVEMRAGGVVVGKRTVIRS